MSIIKKKIVAVGNGCTGKTCLLGFFATSILPDGMTPTVFDNYSAKVVLEEQEVELDLWDTAGAEDYDRLRPLSYPNADVVLICFSVDVPSSYENVEEKWINEIRYHLQDVHVILVGTMIDRRDSSTPVSAGPRGVRECVTPEMGKEMARRIRAHTYLECSSHSNQGVQEVFQAAARVAFLPKTSPKNSCEIQ